MDMRLIPRQKGYVEAVAVVAPMPGAKAAG
jgi:hypothetical protein